MSRALTNLQGNLFSAPKGSVLLHSCNCQGKWGAGIAAQFKAKFPLTHEAYRDFCKRGASPGDILTFDEHGYTVVCLFTSKDYGKYKDSPESILRATEIGLSKLTSLDLLSKAIHAPKINSGLFAVPWEKTESLIKKFLNQNPDFSWTAWTF